MDVVLVQWPTEELRREELRRGGVPRLLLVATGAPPPDVDADEDWVRVPAPDPDVRARLHALARRTANGAPDVPTIDADGLLWVGQRWVSLPPVESRLTAALVARFGAVVSRDQLGRAGWPDGPTGRNALDVHVLRLRRRVAKVGLAIRTVRSRGYLLEHA